jgi:hypothetical protein
MPPVGSEAAPEPLPAAPALRDEYFF